MEKFSPTLIIGLGGIGSSIVEGIYRKFIASNPSDLERANAAFLCLDTDITDINKRLKVMPKDSVIKTSSDFNITVGHYIERIKNKTTVEKWFDTSKRELMSMSLGDGAAQVRMASRLAMMAAINEGKLSPIDNAITKLMSTDPSRKKGNDIKIHIVSSLAGGTGAGTFLQMAYYVKNAMKEHGAEAPKINGYFLLADVLCDDANCGFSKDQKENVRSNTYACMKELVAFASSPDRGKRQFEFEYKLGQVDKRLPIDPPYDSCFIIDYNGADGGNLKKGARYFDQMTSYVFLLAFSNIGGHQRQNAVNDIRQQIESDGTTKYASFGVSRLVYPVDDLFAYFAHESVADNMSTTWCQIDKDIQKRFDEYRQNVFQGIPDTKPDKGTEFMRSVENYKDGAGSIAAQFRHIYNSTQELNEDMTPRYPKSKEYVECVRGFVERTINNSTELTGLREQCTVPSADFTKRDNGDKDLAFVVRRERELQEYRDAVVAFIDGSKQWLVRECFIADHDAADYVSAMPESHKHHLNSFILERDNEMHPLAVRYFLYDVKKRLKSLLDGKEGLRESNKKLRYDIFEGYSEAFDIMETKNKKETASDNLKAARQKNSGFGGIVNLVSRQDPYKAAKENYESLSNLQAENITTYAVDKMLEEVFTGLLEQINLLIEESEHFFENLPAAIQSLDNERQALLTKHNKENADPSIEYVLASEMHKKDIYANVISRSSSPFFPPEMAASVYRTMFDNVYSQIDASAFVTSKKADKKALKAEAIEANVGIIKQTIKYQTALLKETNRNYATMNVIEALKEEAMRECDNKKAKAWDYAKDKFRNFRDRAEIFGPTNLDTEIRYINAWGANPLCTAISTISTSEADELFGDSASDTNPKTAATLLLSEHFSPYEIVRANTVTLLDINKYFKKFLAKSRTDYSEESYGCYYTAYQDVITKMHSPTSKTVSPHLDKYWHLPSYMPSIGSTMAEESKRLFRALYGGLLFGKFKAAYNGGEYYWKYLGTTSQYLKHIDGGMITIGQSQEAALNNLYEKGLVNNPEIVDEVNAYVEDRWVEARNKWLVASHDESNELLMMKETEIAQSIINYRFSIHSSFKRNQSWFTLLNSRKGLPLFNIVNEHRSFFFEDLADRLINVFGASLNTMKLCQFVFKAAGTKMKDDIDILMERLKEERRFEPNE
ncbi:MAG: tubulin-like doman-containing protein [Bacteroidaceae bacterium]|nr:tubulin-like doman-containing protein [Bacteroidaceae bacterium]